MCGECVALGPRVDVRFLGTEKTKKFIERAPFLWPLLLGDRVGGKQTVDVFAATTRRPNESVLGVFALGRHPAHDGRGSLSVHAAKVSTRVHENWLIPDARRVVGPGDAGEGILLSMQARDPRSMHTWCTIE